MLIARWCTKDGSEWVGLAAGTTLTPLQRVDDSRAGDRSVLALAMGALEPNPSGEPVEAATVRHLPPIREPGAVRDFYAFEDHVATARRSRGLDMVPDWYDLPVFYFSNPHTILGPDEVIPHPVTEELDYELEVAAVIGRDVRNAEPDEALAAIAGYTIFNDCSARDVQRREMRLGLGPAKGKDFASVLGPVLATPDELDGTPDRPRGTMVARVNGVEWSRGELGDLHHSFATLIAYASRDSVVKAGDVIGSGTVGTGCILELSAVHGSARHPYLAPGDVVELEVAGIGLLRNPVGDRPQ